jgi:hypothetical protein
MLLYRIQRKSDKQFFAGFRWAQHEQYWNDSGAFYRTPDTIRMHLLDLAGARINRSSMHGRGFSYEITAEKLKNLEQYRVIISDVSIKGTKRLEAFNFVGA